MRLSIIVITVVSLLLFFQPSLSATYEIGVEVGKWAEYEFSIKWTSSSPQATIPKAVEEAKNIDYIKVEVKEVSNRTTVKIVEEIYYKNGTKKIGFYIGDVRTGKGNLSIQIIAANLREGDRIFEDPGAPVINASGFKEYAGVTRMVNKLRLESGVWNKTIIDFYWDRATGFLCEMIVLNNISTETSISTSIITWRITRTNLWTSSPDATFILAGIVFLAIIGCTLYLYLLKTKRDKKLKRKWMRL